MGSNPIIKAYITKYALTTGIYEIEAEHCISTSQNMIKDTKNSLGTYHGKGKDWHIIKEEAIKQAEEMRLKKIKSLEKQIEKLKKLKFE